MPLKPPRAWLDAALLGITLLALAGGGLARWLGLAETARLAWNASALLLAAWLAAESAARLWRRQVGVDLIALLAIVGAVSLGQALVAAVIALMLAGGRALERYTERRAERELRRLIDRAPRFAWCYRGGLLEQVAVERVRPGDRLLVRTGDVLPVDGEVIDAMALLDEAALTGEPLPVNRGAGDAVRSGGVNAGPPFDLRATATAAQSTYAGIVKLAEAARQSRAPSARLADRYALALIPLTLAVAGVAWLLSGDPLRVLAVLVVATPCPLILAVPVAIVGGISRCARRGILVKDGATLEALARVQQLFLDKTGTLTAGRIGVRTVESAGTYAPAQLLHLAGSLAQASPHPVAQAIAQAARERAPLEPPQAVRESAGAGLCGTVAGREVWLGEHGYVAAAVPAEPWSGAMLRRMNHELLDGSFVAVDGAMAGAVLFDDRLRQESPGALRRLRQAGIRRIVMLTGDRAEAAQLVGVAAGVDEVRAGLTPAAKLAAIAEGRRQGVTMMIGDGINDAPALAAADVGVALGARGASASSEAAGVVLLVDRLDRVAEALCIARRARRIAVQGVLAGMGLSLLAMLWAAAGLLPALAGAVLQEAIDVAVIANALRVLGGRAPPALGGAVIDRLREEHAALAPVLQQVRRAAERVASDPPAQARSELDALLRGLERQLVPHEQADEAQLYPQLARRLHGEDPLAAMSHTHREIFRLIHLLQRMVADLAGGVTVASLEEIQRTLLRLDTVLGLHFAQEEELYHSLDDR